MLKILVAEDNVDLRNLMKIRLHRAGYEVLEAGDGQEALDLLEMCIRDRSMMWRISR